MLRGQGQSVQRGKSGQYRTQERQRLTRLQTRAVCERFGLLPRALRKPGTCEALLTSLLSGECCCFHSAAQPSRRDHCNRRCLDCCTNAGLPVDQVVGATALVSLAANVVVALVANMPFGMTPGMGLNAYLVYSQVRCLPALMGVCVCLCVWGGGGGNGRGRTEA